MEEKAVISGEIFRLADELKAQKKLKGDLEDRLDAVKAEITRLDRELSDAMAEAECPKFARGDSTFYLNSRLFASPKAGMNEHMISALKAHGFGDIVKETVNTQTLSSFCKEQIALSGDEETLPDWLGQVVNTFEKVTVGIRKA